MVTRVGGADSRSVLVVEDEPDVRRTLERMLRRESCEVTTAFDGEDAVAKLEKARPALVLTDLEMPRAEGRRVVAVGTTVVRMLESAAADGELAPGEGSAGLFIAPGHRFRVVDALVTNFHLPRTPLLAMVAALAGWERIRAAYETAVRERYRFYSFGDAMLIS
jgi:CheY-like chemotaxis protein